MVLFKQLVTIGVLLCVMFLQVFGKTYPNIEALEGLASQERGKRQDHHGITGPVHTFVKTDKHAHFKWGVRHHVGHHYAGR